MAENAADPADSGINVAVDSERSDGRSVVIKPEMDCETAGPNRDNLLVFSSLPGLRGSCIMLAHVNGAPGELPGPAGARSGSFSPDGADCRA